MVMKLRDEALGLLGCEHSRRGERQTVVDVPKLLQKIYNVELALYKQDSHRKI